MAFWITLIRGILAIILGLTLVFWPDKAQPILVNFMGMYWLTSGIVSLRWGAQGEKARGLALLAGALGVLAGIGMLSRSLTKGIAGEETLIAIMGLIILLTGLMHIFGGFRTDLSDLEEIPRSGPNHPRFWPRTWSWTAFLLGLFEIVLGAMMIITPLDLGLGVYLAASVWALLGGIILIGDAMRLRRLRQAAQREKTASVQAADRADLG